MRNNVAKITVAVLGVLMLVATASPIGADDTSGGKCLFDGKTLEGWEGKSQFWSVQDGAITGQTTPENPTKGNTFLIWRGGELADFELTLQFRIVGGNSGIQYRSEELDDFVVRGYQSDFMDGDRFMGILYEEKGRGILALRGQKVTISEDGKKNVTGKTCDDAEMLASINKQGWNTYVIRAKGNHLVQQINGFTTVDVTDNQTTASKSKGILALQLHAGPPMLVQFKDIMLKELK
jgi:hypothetical protein